MNYYGIVRSTLTYVDGQMLTASINLTTIPLTIFLGAATINHFSDKTIGYVGVAGLCLIAVIIAMLSKAKIDLFNHFITETVLIALKIEDELKLNIDIRITKQFEVHKSAGERGNLLFLISLHLYRLPRFFGSL